MQARTSRGGIIERHREKERERERDQNGRHSLEMANGTRGV